jgi:uncharacterized protein YkwD
MDSTRKHFIILILALAMLLSLPWAWAQWLPSEEVTGPPLPGLIPLYQVAEEIYPLVNEARRQKGLPLLIKDQGLAVVALTYCQDMLRRQFFGHTSPDGLSLKARLVSRYQKPFAKAGENIWTGSGYDIANSRLLAGAIMKGWMDSPGHRDNLLDPSFTHLGVGVAALGREVRATQLFVQRPSSK